MSIKYKNYPLRSKIGVILHFLFDEKTKNGENLHMLWRDVDLI